MQHEIYCALFIVRLQDLQKSKIGKRIDKTEMIGIV